jgi:hypothetical protein
MVLQFALVGRCANRTAPDSHHTVLVHPQETALSTVLLELVSASQSSCAQLATTTPDSDGLPDATAPQLPDIATQAAQGLDLAASIACKVGTAHNQLSI